ncbi:MAG: helix-turn-helix transcriptional regulator [Candidatus Synoicihabitans palmerolidicus]|nr:helix-turn-helix transcriptional regulator [Candidatus Synoicihabitans palmerolidicus]
MRLAAREALGEAEPATMQAWVTLLQTHTHRLVGGPRRDPRLNRLWHAVESDLSHPWKMTQMAALATVSEEHLRRLCHRFHQHSPASYLTRLRMHRAGVLLRATNATVEVVSQQVGFDSVHAFSIAFKRWSSVPPSVYRQLGDRSPVMDASPTIPS